MNDLLCAVIDRQSLQAIEAACATSRAAHRLDTEEDVKALMDATDGVSSYDDATKRMSLLVQSIGSPFDTTYLRDLALALRLNSELRGDNAGDSEAVMRVVHALPAGTSVRSVAEAEWSEAITWARVAGVGQSYLYPDDRHEAVIKAAIALKNRGYVVPEAPHDEVSLRPLCEAVTADISRLLSQLGLWGGLYQISALIAKLAVSQYDQFLIPRRYSTGPATKAPSVPLGFLLNLAVKTNQRRTSISPESDWVTLVKLASDIAALLNIEPYNRFSLVNLPPPRLRRVLREVGIFDHLFTLRQWPAGLTPLVIEAVFRPHSDAFRANLGFDVDDMLEFVSTINRYTNNDLTRLAPSQFDPDAQGRFGKLRPFVVHAIGTVNQKYQSPLDAEASNLMFKPLLEVYGNALIALPAPLLGPACYEAFASAARQILSKAEQAKLVGEGTERALAAVLGKRGIVPSLAGAKYNEGSAGGQGECDFVLETPSHIIFIETKAKALTRATMAGISGAAVNDFVFSVLASQAQALRHERLLHINGEIRFTDGQRLELRGRKTLRLSVTLLDHGALHDREFFLNVVMPLMQVAPILEAPTGTCKATNDLRDAIETFRQEWDAARMRNGDVGITTGLAAVAVSVGQFDSMLGQVGSVGGLVDLWKRPAVFGTLNPLLEAFYLGSLNSGTDTNT